MSHIKNFMVSNYFLDIPKNKHKFLYVDKNQ